MCTNCSAQQQKWKKKVFPQLYSELCRGLKLKISRRKILLIYGVVCRHLGFVEEQKKKTLQAEKKNFEKQIEQTHKAESGYIKAGEKKGG